MSRNKKELLVYIFKRIGLMLFSFFIILTICFFLVRLLPNTDSTSVGQDQTMYERMLKAYGRDKPLLVQYGLFWKNLFYPYFTDENGVTYELSRFGYSWKIEMMTSPLDMLVERFPPTIIMNIYSLLISIPLGIILGVLMALFKNKKFDYIMNIIVMFFISIPSFVVAFFMQYLFYYKWHLIPYATMPSLTSGMTWFSPSIQQAMILPVITMSLGTIAGFSRFTRAELSEILSSNFMVLARSKGLSKFEAIVFHGLRNSFVPIFPMILGQIISIFSGSVIIEQIFGVPGVGSIFLKSITLRDYDVFLFVGMFYTFIGLLGSLIVDISYGIIDPRIKVMGRKLS